MNTRDTVSRMKHLVDLGITGTLLGRPMWGDMVAPVMERFYRERFHPTLEPLLELPFDAVLPTHGQPLLKGGKQALKAALSAKPWNHHG